MMPNKTVLTPLKTGGYDVAGGPLQTDTWFGVVFKTGSRWRARRPRGEMVPGAFATRAAAIDALLRGQVK